MMKQNNPLRRLLAALLAALYRNGAAVVKAVKVSAATPTGYEAAFAALEQEAVDVIVCDSTSVDVQLKLRASVEGSSEEDVLKDLKRTARKGSAYGNRKHAAYGGSRRS